MMVEFLFNRMVLEDVFYVLGKKIIRDILKGVLHCLMTKSFEINLSCEILPILRSGCENTIPRSTIY